MVICAVSDLHGRLPVIPPCDVLLIAGDVCPDDFPQLGMGYDTDLIREEQRRWLSEDFAAWEGTVPASHILATPGNHDWITSFPDGLRTRLCIDEFVTITSEVFKSATFYFTPWVDHCGYWNYQLDRAGRALRFADIPARLDVLVAHSPAHDVLDSTYSNEHVGCHELRRVVQQKQPRFMVHGHIHEGQRFGKRQQLGNTTVYNVAMWGENWRPTVFEI